MYWGRRDSVSQQTLEEKDPLQNKDAWEPENPGFSLGLEILKPLNVHPPST